MTKFEKIAETFDATSQIILLPEIVSGVKKIDENAEAMEITGNMFHLVAVTLKKRPDAMRRLIALDRDAKIEDVEDMEENELITAACKVFRDTVIPFFTARKRTEGRQ